MGWRVGPKPYVKAAKLAYENNVFKEDTFDSLQHSDV